MEEIHDLDWGFRREYHSEFSKSFGVWHRNPLLRDYYIPSNYSNIIRNQIEMEILKENDN